MLEKLATDDVVFATIETVLLDFRLQGLPSTPAATMAAYARKLADLMLLNGMYPLEY